MQLWKSNYLKCFKVTIYTITKLRKRAQLNRNNLNLDSKNLRQKSKFLIDKWNEFQ